MSLTPIFDAALADAPVGLWLVSDIFPWPDYASLWERLHVDPKDWVEASRTTNLLLATDPANLSFLGDVA